MKAALARGAAAVVPATVAFVLVLFVLSSVARAPTSCPDRATGPASDAPASAPPTLARVGLRR